MKDTWCQVGAVGVNIGAAFNMYGRSITGIMKPSFGGDDSCAVRVWSGGSANINGGTITENRRGIFAYGSLCVSGDAKITGNTDFDVYLASGNIITVGALTSGADIGVTSPNSENDVAITGTTTTDYSQYFNSDDSNRVILYNDNIVYLHRHNYEGATCSTLGTCSVCGEQGGELDATNHNLSAEWSSDGKTHWHDCLYGCDTRFDETEHSADAPTCLIAPICEVCDTAFREINPEITKVKKPIIN